MRVLATAGGRDISLLMDNNGRSETMTFDHVAFPFKLVPFSNMSQVGNVVYHLRLLLGSGSLY